MKYYVYVKVKEGIALDSVQPTLHKATIRIIQLRKSGQQAQSFTEEEIMEMQTQQPVQQHQQQPIQRPKHKRGIVRMPHKQPAITVGMNHIQKRRR